MIASKFNCGCQMWVALPALPEPHHFEFDDFGLRDGPCSMRCLLVPRISLLLSCFDDMLAFERVPVLPGDSL
jgi:hypothetical protein